MRQVPIKPSTTTPSGASLCSRLIEICLVCAVLAVLSAQRALAAPEPIQPTSPIRRIDRIHLTGNERTQTQIIERELLFAVGDTLDEAVVAETERNLRRLLYLGDATISTVVQNDSTASIRIAVQDLYSRALSPLIAGQTSELSYGLVALDYNFLGRGQVAQVEVNHDPVSGNRITASHRFPRLTEARLALASDFTAAAEGHDLSLSLSRSYHSLSTRWSYGTRLSSHESISRLYAGRSLTARYSSSSEAATTWFGHSAGDQTKVRSSFSMTVQDRSFTPTQGFSYTPTDRRRVLPAVALTLWRPRFKRARHVQQLGRLEDLQVGSSITLRASLSHRGLGSDRTFPVFSGLVVPRFVIGQSTFGFASLSISSRIQNSSYTNLITSSQLRTYHRVGDVHSIAGRVRFDTVSRSEDAAQFLLGVDRGLRGYEPRSLDGSRRLLFNLEARPTLYTNPDYVLAAALFVDGGRVWSPPASDPYLRIAIGAGARIGLPRVYSTPVIRVDVARGRVWQVSAAVGHYF